MYVTLSIRKPNTAYMKELNTQYEKKAFNSYYNGITLARRPLSNKERNVES